MKTNTLIKAFAACTASIGILFSLSGCGNDAIVTLPGEKTAFHELDHSFYHVAIPGDEEKKRFRDLIVVTIDPSLYEFSIYVNKDRGNAKTIREIQEETGALLSFNGNFFTEEFQSTGLLINSSGQLKNRSRAALLNGIIAIDKNKEVHFFNNDQFPQNENDTQESSAWEFAIQNGPVLLRNGEITVTPNAKESASRTALGRDTSGNLVLIVVKQSLLKSDNTLSLYEFARMLKESPELKELKLQDVLNLDGGRSTGLMIGENYYAEMDYVQNVVTVKKRR